MNLHTHNGWETTDWEQGEPIPDQYTASLMFIHERDLIPHMDKDDVIELSRLIESPVNASFQENDDVEDDRWILSGLMFQKTTWIDKDPENTSLAGESIELNVVNEESDESEYELPLVYRRWIPMDQLKQMMDFTGATGEQRIPDEVMNACGLLDIGIATQSLVTSETCKTFKDLVSERAEESEE